MGHVDQSLSASTWIEVGLVDIIGEDRRDSDQLGRTGGCNRHEHDEKHGNCTTTPKKSHSCVRNNETS